MKKYLIIIALLASMPLFAERVDPETARKVATTFLNNNGAKAAQLTDLSRSAGFSNLYIFTAEEGFVVMAADDCMKPILGYSLTGQFKTDGMPENVRGWLQGYSDEIQYAIDNQAKASSETVQLWNDLMAGKPGVAKTTVVVEPLIQTKWNQGSPYNNLCPFDTTDNRRTVTGCVATAMAQIMKYWEHPSQGIGSHSYIPKNHPKHGEQTADFGATTYLWSNMPTSLSPSSSSDQINAVAMLMYHCGVSVDMDYDYSQQNTSHSGSSASTYNVMSALRTYFRYAPTMQYKSKNDYSDEIWITMLKHELDNGRPLQYRGKDAINNGGHSFVCDGYESNDNFHFNWGWGGYCDGYYSVNNMNPNPNASATGAGNGVYTVSQEAIFGIEPISNLTAPTITASIVQNTIVLTWEPVEGVSSYDVYKNNEKVGTDITNTTYVDTDIQFGVYYEYYVRSVSSNTYSNPSNTVIKKSLYRDLTPSNLSLTQNEDDITLSWVGHGGTSMYLHYGISDNYYLPATNPVYWGQKYVASELTYLAGMCIDQVSINIHDTGNYIVYLYKANTADTDNLLYQQNFTVTQSGWNTITLDNPINISVFDDLWVVFHTDISNPWLIIDVYNGDNVQHADYYNSSLESIGEQSYVADASWPIKVHITDGIYTYNLYDGQTLVNGNESINGTSYTITEPINNGIHHYTVKTSYYGGESSASNMAILAKGTTSISSLQLGTNDKMLVTENSTLTVSGDLINNNPDNLILEDGAQLVTSSDDVVATVKKNINDWETTNWYFIASPISTAITPIGLITDELGSAATPANATYDLYSLDVTQENAWRNYRQHPFNLNNGMGYLYASKEGTTLSFCGTIQPSDDNITVNNLNEGFNLVGNPYTCTAYVNQPHYTLDQASAGITRSTVATPMTTTIAACTGVIVESTSNGSVTFSKDVPSTSTNQGSIQLTLSQQVAARDGSKMETLDNAIVSFNEGDQLHKFYFGTQNANIYLPQNNEEYAIVNVNTQGSIPVNFKANSDGTYTLTLSSTLNSQLSTLNSQLSTLNFNYLHLIDNLTGADIDLLTSPSYEFEAKTDDYASRFRLVFDTQNDSDENDSFAFISDGLIFITGVNGNATLQVVDMTGRTILRRDGACTVSTDGLAASVYVLRLIEGETIKTQKIIIK